MEADWVTDIGELAFSSSPISTITIPASVTSLGENVFLMCTSLVEVIIKATVPPTIDLLAFSDCHSSLKIYVPRESVTAYTSASGWKSYSGKIYAGDF